MPPLLAGGDFASFQNKVHLALNPEPNAPDKTETEPDGLQMRHRRPAECRQVDPLQRADPDRGGAGGELSVLHHRAQCRRRRRARSRGSTRWRASPRSPQIIPTRLTFVDIAGLVRGASKGEGLGNQFLANIREVDAIAHVVRCFEDGDVTHVEGRIDPIADIETIETELMLADLDSLEKRVDEPREEGTRRRQGSQGAVRPRQPRARRCCARASPPASSSASPRRKRPSRCWAS